MTCFAWRFGGSEKGCPSSMVVPACQEGFSGPFFELATGVFF